MSITGILDSRRALLSPASISMPITNHPAVSLWTAQDCSLQDSPRASLIPTERYQTSFELTNGAQALTTRITLTFSLPG
jgi:hypothetical protein